MAIPKIIHYCWFGHNPLPDSAKKCIESWKLFCPDYVIKLWNEDNFDINFIPFCKQAYDAQKYAFVTDYARLKIIYENGGIYLDTDVELLQSLNPLLNYDLFMGAEGENFINTGLGFGSIANHQLIHDNMEIYEKIDFIDKNGNIIGKNCPFYTTEICKKYNFKFPLTAPQENNNIILFPNDYFNPYHWKTDTLKITQKTYSIHHYASTWMTAEQRNALIMNAKFDTYEKRYGKYTRKIIEFLYWNLREKGFRGTLSSIFSRIIK